MPLENLRIAQHEQLDYWAAIAAYLKTRGTIVHRSFGFVDSGAIAFCPLTSIEFALLQALK